jgi:hypothetical protein
MKTWLLLWAIGGVACSAKQESSSTLPVDEAVEAERTEDEVASEECLSSCEKAMAMQARSAESIADACRERCSGETQLLAPRELE